MDKIRRETFWPLVVGAGIVSLTGIASRCFGNSAVRSASRGLCVATLSAASYVLLRELRATELRTIRVRQIDPLLSEGAADPLPVRPVEKQGLSTLPELSLPSKHGDWEEQWKAPCHSCYVVADGSQLLGRNDEGWVLLDLLTGAIVKERIQCAVNIYEQQRPQGHSSPRIAIVEGDQVKVWTGEWETIDCLSTNVIEGWKGIVHANGRYSLITVDDTGVVQTPQITFQLRAGTTVEAILVEGGRCYLVCGLEEERCFSVDLTTGREVGPLVDCDVQVGRYAVRLVDVDAEHLIGSNRLGLEIQDLLEPKSDVRMLNLADTEAHPAEDIVRWSQSCRTEQHDLALSTLCNALFFVDLHQVSVRHWIDLARIPGEFGCYRAYDLIECQEQVLLVTLNSDRTICLWDVKNRSLLHHSSKSLPFGAAESKWKIQCAPTSTGCLGLVVTTNEHVAYFTPEAPN